MTDIRDDDESTNEFTTVTGLCQFNSIVSKKNLKAKGYLVIGRVKG